MNGGTALATVLLAICEDLDRRGYQAVGVLRQAARELYTADAAVARLEDRLRDLEGRSRPGVAVVRCRGCGTALPAQDGRGRPRQWCERPACQTARRDGRKNRKKVS